MTPIGRLWRWPARTRPMSIPTRIVANAGSIGLLSIALVQGLIYLFLVPPWQHYDEPTHFEYAWLIANRGRLPQVGDVDDNLRREIAGSMLAYKFYQDLPKPNLLADRGELSIGYTQLVHPPAYYILLSGPLYLARYLDVTSQLYVGRFVSLILFVGTIAIVRALMRDLTPPGHILRWAVPLALVFLPPFADVMTAVNNDVGAVFVATLFFWQAIRTIRDGLTWGRIAILISVAALATVTKSTALFTVVLVPFVMIMAFSVQRGWRLRWIRIGGFGLASLALLASLTWGDAAYWYRSQQTVTQANTTQIALPNAPWGTNALRLQPGANQGPAQLVEPLPAQAVRQLAGRSVTVGGWVWGAQPNQQLDIGLLINEENRQGFTTTTKTVDVSTTPTFVAWTLTIPQRARMIQFNIATKPTSANGNGEVYIDGAILADGVFASTAAPTFDTANATGGTWNNRPFVNMLRNPSAESAWPRPRLWIEQELGRRARRSPAQILFSILDVRRTGETLVGWAIPTAFEGLVARFAWGGLNLSSTIWVDGLYGVTALAIIGCLRWWGWDRRRGAAWMRVALLLLGLGALLVWGSTILRPLPLLDGRAVTPATRYTFPAIVPTILAIVGGWWALWPRRLRLPAVGLLLSSLVVLNLVALGTIWTYYYAA